MRLSKMGYPYLIGHIKPVVSSLLDVKHLSADMTLNVNCYANTIPLVVSIIPHEPCSALLIYCEKREFDEENAQ